MPGLATAAPTGLFATLEHSLRSFGTNPLIALKNIDLQTVGLVGAGILLAILLIDLLGYLYAAYKGTSSDYTPYSRSLLLTAADAWDNRHSNVIGDYYDPYARARSLEPLTEVLDAVSEAVHKWGAAEGAPQGAAPHQWNQELDGSRRTRKHAHHPSPSSSFIFSQ